jgi:hypothetical protein
MKRHMLELGVVLLLVAGAGTVLTVQAAKDDAGGPKGKEVSLNGRLACTFCSLAHPGKPCKEGCCKGCIQAGDPPLLIDKEGTMYLLLGNENKKPVMTAERLELAGGPVTVKGLLVKGKGIQAIFVDSLAKQ